MTEVGLVQAIREIYNFFWERTGERYTKTQLSECYTIFTQAAREVRMLTVQDLYGPAMSPDDMVAIARTTAEAIMSRPDEDELACVRELDELRRTNPVMHSLVKSFLQR